VEGDLLCDGDRAHARDGQLPIVAKPGVEAILWRIGTGRHAGIPFVTCFCSDTGGRGGVVRTDYTTVTTQKGHFLSWIDSLFAAKGAENTSKTHRRFSTR